ncbi:MAG: SigE family RNA polymerase sigma factor [Acidimicrobiaceae bacterium]|nr:SigE family RNA polymerase sigma factor [Acidimicrobiaceae bacterium]
MIDETEMMETPAGGHAPDYNDFFATVLPAAVSTARRITGDLASAEDAACEALARAYLRWPRLRSADHREAWVLRVTINEAIGVVRKRARWERILQKHAAVPPWRDEDDNRELLVQQVRRLPDRQREVVALRFFADLSTDEVADALGISPGSVKTHLHRALATLRDRVGPDVVKGTLE